MIFLRPFYFLTPMDYSPWFEREIWPFLKASKNSETGEAMPIKLSVHAFHINLYLYQYIEPILFFYSVSVQIMQRYMF